MGFATGKLTDNSEAFPSEIGAQIEHVYRGVYLLSTLKRDEMLREGQQEEVDRIHKEARKSQESIRNQTSKPVA